MARAVKGLVESTDNVAAVKALVQLRLFMGTPSGRLRTTPLPREEFSMWLAGELEGSRIPSSTLHDWESGDHVIPGAVTSAASRVLGKLLGEPPSVEYYLSLSWVSRPRLHTDLKKCWMPDPPERLDLLAA